MTCALHCQSFWVLHRVSNIPGTALVDGFCLRSSFLPPNLEQISSIGMQCNYNASLKRWDGTLMTCALHRQSLWVLHRVGNIPGTALVDSFCLRSSFLPPNLEQISSIGMQCNYNASLKRWDLRVTPPIVLGSEWGG